MDSYNYFVINPKNLEPNKISEHLPPSVLYASIDPILQIRLVSQYFEEENVTFVTRPDIAKLQKNLPYKYYVEFKSRHSIKIWLNEQEEIDVIVQVFHKYSDYNLVTIKLKKYCYRELKEKKLARIAKLLYCPSCRASLKRELSNFLCTKCGNRYAFNGNAVNFLTNELKTEFSITETENISDHGFDSRVSEAIESSPDKLFIDVGAGFKYTCYENVVNFEIVDYPSTDVLGVGEKMPFANDSFDGVISAVVLEHVKDPFACAREMVRILKPGGSLYCSAPFLQPRHGYPNHYYNMTKEGLINLFEDMEILEANVPIYLHPMAAINWILGGYTTGLPENLREQFLSMKIIDIMKLWQSGESYNHPLFAQLDPETMENLSCGTYIHAIKPQVY